MGTRIAIVGLACEYPDASSPMRLWENALAQRRAFRRLPDERMRRADYCSPDRGARDRSYCEMAAVIEGYEFDRVAFAVAGSTYRSTDLTHWLALDVAARALADAGFAGGSGLPADATGVIVGNTLTGEFARANLMRLRWPYVRRTVAAALADEGWEADRVQSFLAGLEDRYKKPFPPPDEDTLAGGLSNTIAGRICNYFDLHGGGYTVDGACSSSLLAVATACSQLADHGIDVAIAGGVDLSIDPFELVGFARVGALTGGPMRVYDRGDSGFWPGEGAGMAILMREEDAAAQGLRPYALISGWGVSSDGRGGITRPEVRGYQLAMRRAYDRSGFGPDTVPYFEGHSTGTPAGDAVELEAISRERRDADPNAAPSAIGSIKALIGHTKAACGIASLIKAVLAVHEGIIPPTAGCVDPHPLLTGERPALRASRGERWPEGQPRRAGVTSMGFGGINTHVVVEEAVGSQPGAGTGPGRPGQATGRMSLASLLASAQDEELLIFDAEDQVDLTARLRQAADLLPALSYAELTDLAVTLHGQYAGRPARAAVVADSPMRAAASIRRLLDALRRGEQRLLEPETGAFTGQVTGHSRIGLLFPGQGSAPDAGPDLGGIHRRRFPQVADLYDQVALPPGRDPAATEIAQPRIIAASLAGLRILDSLAIEANVAVGHSVGELAALRWAGVFDDAAALRIASARGAAMARSARPDGAMASIGASAEVVASMLNGHGVVIAALNGPRQTVIAGPADAVGAIGHQAVQQGFAWTRLNVSHAFHSPLVEPAVQAFSAHLTGERFGVPQRRVISTVTGAELSRETDLRALLRDQITRPVRFLEAITSAGESGIGLFLEVGPGAVLSGLAREAIGVPVFPLSTDGRSLGPLLRAAAAAVVTGVPLCLDALFESRLARPLKPNGTLRFFTSPCEAAPACDQPSTQLEPTADGDMDVSAGPDPRDEETTLGLLRRLAAERTELPLESVQPGSRLLDDLHLSSITVGQIVTTAAQQRGLATMAPVTSFATATVAELAQTLDELAVTANLDDDGAGMAPEGAGPWIRPFAVDWVKAERPRQPSARIPGKWTMLATDGHPLAKPLLRALDHAGIGGGVALCLPPDCGAQHIGLLLDAARTALAADGPQRLAVIQHGRGATALAKTLHLESPQVTTCVIDVSPDTAAVDWIVAEVASATGFTEVRLDADGARRVPLLRPLDLGEPVRPALTAKDVMLVTGGGKGITAECARAIALDSGTALAILGRADPAADAELAANLDRLREARIRHCYLRADLTNRSEVARAIREARARLGEVTAIMHGAGRNEPAPLATLEEEAFRRTVAPKVDGLRTVLDAIDKQRLRLLVGFGSIIGRTGLRGQADYAIANDWLTALITETGRELAGCRCLSVEWSVWSGAGMGERLGVVEALARQGITPISPDAGIAVLRRLIGDPATPPAVVVSGRLGGLSTVTFEPSDLPLARFTDKAVVHYPGIELITEAQLSEYDDPYLTDHRVDGEMIFPGVLALEAMTQVATAVTGRTTIREWKNVEFSRPIIIRPGGATTIRVAALARDANTVEVEIRSSETRFAAGHMRGICTLSTTPQERVEPPAASLLPLIPSDPVADLYGTLLFQGPRFQHLAGYRQLGATGCLAEISGGRDVPWFAPTVASRLVLAHPGPRDAFMHAIQACVPDATLLPARVGRLVPARGPWPERMVLSARERRHEGQTYVYDLAVFDDAGRIVEQWDGLRLSAVSRRDGRGPWFPPLLGPFLERRLASMLPGRPMRVAVEPEATGERAPAAERAASRVLGRPARLRHRPDGRAEPWLDSGPQAPGADAGPETGISLAHGPGLVFAVAGPAPLGCDVEPAARRPASEWAGLLGSARQSLVRLVADETGEDETVAATRAWSATECLVKTGRSASDPLTLAATPEPGWVVFTSGSARVVTFVTALRGTDDPVVFAVLTEEQENR
ncbi:MAG: SDR family NAD(P)-dependent oxidoreductase [Streptosporangiaceae bacterium]|nr:SDR family NAD(P)-dependent oxidoreductase [Streptosporangiaceae bacterium]